MKQITMILLSIVIATGSIFAQNERRGRKAMSPEMRAQKHTEKLTTLLGLTPEQQPKVKEVILMREQKRAEVFGQHKDDKPTAKNIMREVNKTSEEKLKAILTPEQFQKLMDHRKEMKQKRMNKRKQNNSPKPGEQVPAPGKTKPPVENTTDNIDDDDPNY